MKNIITIIIILLSIKSFTQTSADKHINTKKELYQLFSYNNIQIINSNYVYNLSLTKKKSSVLINGHSSKWPNAININNYNPNKNYSCMFYWVIPIIAGVLFVDSYKSFKDGNKKEGYIQLGIGTTILVGSTIYIILERKKNK